MRHVERPIVIYVMIDKAAATKRRKLYMMGDYRIGEMLLKLCGVGVYER